MATRITTSIRLPGDLRKRIIDRAKKNKRSFTAEIEYLTECGLDLEESTQARELRAAINGASA